MHCPFQEEQNRGRDGDCLIYLGLFIHLSWQQRSTIHWIYEPHPVHSSILRQSRHSSARRPSTLRSIRLQCGNRRSSNGWGGLLSKASVSHCLLALPVSVWRPTAADVDPVDGSGSGVATRLPNHITAHRAAWIGFLPTSIYVYISVRSPLSAGGHQSPWTS